VGAFLAISEEEGMRTLHRFWHVCFGHQIELVDLTHQPWTANCSCGFRFRVREFAMGQLASTERA
jgi:hypothetical protein